MGVPLPERFGWKRGAKTWFVDGLQGSDGNYGQDAENAFQTIGYAISRASAYDVIYVLDKGHDGGTDPYAYTESTTNLSIAMAKNNLAIIGVPHNIHEVYGLQIKPVSASTGPALSVYAPFTTIENLCFNKRGDGVGSCVYFRDDGDTTYQAQGSSIYNCHLRNADMGSAARTTAGGVYINGGWYYTIKDCTFMDCHNGVSYTSGTSTVKKLTISGCTFNGTTTNIDTDIYGAGTVYATLIDRCNFAHEVPAFAGAGALTAYVYDLVSSGFLLSNSVFNTNDASCKDTVTNEIVTSADGTVVGCYDGAGLVAWA
jgi:hypothetical protein